jgi:GT2 family glycosyltransferase
MPDLSRPLVAVVVLNTNRCEDTLACLASLAALEYPRYEVLLLDNASTDGSVEAVRAQYPSVGIHALTDNRGYAGNDNVGIEAAMALGADVPERVAAGGRRRHAHRRARSTGLPR